MDLKISDDNFEVYYNKYLKLWENDLQEKNTNFRGTDLRSFYLTINTYLTNLIYRLAGSYNDTPFAPLVYFAIYCQLLKDGYLSYNHNFAFGQDENELPIYWGASVLSGKGVCRNISTHLRDILLELNEKNNRISFSPRVFATNYGLFKRRMYKKMNFCEIIEIPKEEKKESFVKKHNLPNHLDVLLIIKKEDGELQWYILDPTHFHIEEFEAKNYTQKPVNMTATILDVFATDYYSKLHTDDETVVKECMRKEYNNHLDSQKLFEKIVPTDIDDNTLDFIWSIGENIINNNLDQIEKFNAKLKYQMSRVKKWKDEYGDAKKQLSQKSKN